VLLDSSRVVEIFKFRLPNWATDFLIQTPKQRLLQPENPPPGNQRRWTQKPAMASAAPCAKCAGKNFISLNANANDNNY